MNASSRRHGARDPGRRPARVYRVPPQPFRHVLSFGKKRPAASARAAARGSIGVTDPALRERISFLGLTERDLGVVAAWRDVCCAATDRLVDEFYAHIATSPTPKGILERHTSVERQRPMLTRYVLTMFDGVVDDAYAAYRTRVGQVHDQIDLDSNWYVAMYEVIRRVLNEAVAAAGASPDEARDFGAALARLVQLDLALAVTAPTGARSSRCTTPRASARRRPDGGRGAPDATPHATSHVFTGLVDDVGRIEAVTTTDAGREFRIRTRYQDLVEGESIACDGACLTVREFGPADDGSGGSWFTVAAVVTTLGRTVLGEWQAGRAINLERALRAGDRLGGHLVQGHVDGVGTVVAVEQRGDAWLIDVALPPELDALMVPHGSVTVDGVSLTVNALPRPGVLQLSIIEYTHRHTTLGLRGTGDRVHVEGDVVGKYVRRLLAPYLAALPGAIPAASAAPAGVVTI